MATTQWYESNYRFTGPIRLFKANDPYFYKVDNIPLTQLEENSLFLKDQIEGLLSKEEFTGVRREDFVELQPYVDGTNSTVRVRPGRYSARINDAYTIDPLQFITQTLDIPNLQANSWSIETNIGESVSAVIEQIQSSLSEDALHMNGLAERAFLWPVQSTKFPGEFLVGPPNPNTFGSIGDYKFRVPFPGYTGQLWNTLTGNETRLLTLSDFRGTPETIDYLGSGKAASEFIKRWRGVTRTAIVDVPEELTIEIPAFDEDEFYYIDAGNTRRLLEASQRIDLVFIYSKSIDQESTTLASYQNGTPRTITQPVLGIVKGAGIGVSERYSQSNINATDIVDLQDSNGTPLILPHVADINSTAGFSGTLKGSFPSPDDLMNLAPLLSESLEANSPALIGQSILPVAYVVVKNSAALNSQSQPIISNEDLIDIRPFFRTAELTYNERAGIAAAIPQISLANPVASEGYIDSVVQDIKRDYVQKIVNTTAALKIVNTPRIVATGYIKGGFYYGVESVLGDYLRQNFGFNTVSQLKQAIIDRNGYPPGTVIPDFPDWDVAEWCKRGDYSQRGVFPNDRINFHTMGRRGTTAGSLPYGAFREVGEGVVDDSRARIEKLSTDGIQVQVGAAGLTDVGHTCIYFVKKTIQIDRSAIQWARDYHVDVQLWNCAPMSCRSHKDGNNTQVAANASVWVDKREEEFTIFVSWVAADYYNRNTLGNATEPGPAAALPYENRDDGQQFAGFSIINSDILSADYADGAVPGESAAGAAIYPTVSFKVIGIPETFEANAINLNTTNPVLALK